MSEKTYSELTEEELAMMEAEALKLFDDNSTSSVSKDYIKQNSAQIIELSKLLGFDADFLSDFENFLSDDENTENYEEMPEIQYQPSSHGLKVWGNALISLAKVIFSAIIDECANENSSFKQATPIPKYLDVFLIGDDVWNLVEKTHYKNEKGFGTNYNWQKFNFWKTIIDNSDYEGYFTTEEYLQENDISFVNSRSIKSSIASQAKKLNIKVRYKENTKYFNGGLIYAYPVEFLDDWFMENYYIYPAKK